MSDVANEATALINGEVQLPNSWLNDKIFYKGNEYPPMGAGLQNAIDDASDAELIREAIFLPQGTIETDKTIDLNTRVHLIGAGNQATFLKPTDSVSGTTLEITATGGYAETCFELRNVRIYAPEGSSYSVKHLGQPHALRVWNSWLEGLYVDGDNDIDVALIKTTIWRPLELEEGNGLRALSADLYFPYEGGEVILRDPSTSAHHYSHTLVNCRIRKLSNPLTLIGITKKAIISNCDFTGAKSGKTTDAISLEDSGGGEATTDVLIQGNTFYQKTDKYENCISLKGGADYNIIKNNNMRGAYTSKAINNVSGNANGIIVDNLS